MLKEFDRPFLIAPNASESRAGTPIEFASFEEEVRGFKEFETATRVSTTPFLDGAGQQSEVPTYINEFWTAGQRAADNLHEVSYRACFKPQLPRFFIQRLTSPGDVVYDPFMGRGTTLLEAALMGRVPAGNDINPLSPVLIKPRLNPPDMDEIKRRLDQIKWNDPVEIWDELHVFFHPETLQEITNLKQYLQAREQNGTLDHLDEWIRMVAINRLTGHSPGFFSVYTLPPNQAVSIQSQQKINQERNQIPPRKNVPALILKKSRNLLKDITPEKLGALRSVGEQSILANAPAAETTELPSGSISLVVTSPPFLDVVQYAIDNWLRCWFIGVDAHQVKLTVPGKLEKWQQEMTRVFRELQRLLRPGGHIAFEVGEVRSGKIKLEETVLTCGTEAGLEPKLVLINDQEFTKTANCWGVNNNAKGTNTNRIVLFQKP